MIRIITDSAADFEPEEMQQLKVDCVPLFVTFGRQEYQENVNLSKRLFYQLLRTQNDIPSTSQPSPYIFQCIFEEAMASNDETIVITISSALSGVYQTANLARSMSEYKDCYIIDSCSAAGGQRLLVEEAVRLRAEGKTAAQIARQLEYLKEHICVDACMDTLVYLFRGGRISQSLYSLCSTARVKPIIHVNHDGSIGIASRAVGMKRGIVGLFKRLKMIGTDKQYPIYVMHTGNVKRGMELADFLIAMGYSISKKQIVNVGAAVGCHIGPDACGLAYVTAH